MLFLYWHFILQLIKVFLNAKGFEKEERRELKSFLNYVNDSSLSNDKFIERLNNRIEQIKQSKEWKREYMTLQMKLDERYYSGFEKGIEEGRVNNIINAIKNNFNFEQLKVLFNITQEEYNKYVELVNNGEI